MKLVVLGSGSGTNALSILQEFQKDKLGKVTEISLFSDVKDSGFLKHGTAFGCKTSYLKTCPNRAKIIGKYEANWINEIDSHKPGLIVLAGFMKILSKNFIHFFDGRIINLHPSLLPSFKGLDAIKRAFTHGVKITGCTVHWVNDSIDCGQIIDQSPVRIFDDDDLDNVTSRIHAAEHYLLPKVIRELSENIG